GQDRDRLLAVGGVVIDEDELLTLPLVHAAHLLAHVLHHHRGLRPVGGDEREHVGEYASVGGRRAAVAHRDDRDAVRGGLLDQRVGDAGRERVDDRRAGRRVLLAALVALHAAGVVVFGLALLPGELDAVHAAVALVQHLHVVDDAAAE